MQKIQKLQKLFINNEWVEGEGQSFQSLDPGTQNVLWQGKEASEKQIQNAISAASSALKEWSSLTLEERSHFLEAFNQEIEEHKPLLIHTLSQENGKPLWESENEINGLLGKLSISIQSYHERCASHKKDHKEQKADNDSHFTESSLIYHKPHGVVAVFAPFNFPLHIATGHMIPALLAGNTVILKPSELTPLVSEYLIQCYERARFPKGVVNLIQGGPGVGKILANHPELNGLFFTGSAKAGQSLRESFSKTPAKILALELGGNNPLIVHQMNPNTIEAAVLYTIQSAFITAGQRCTCSRRLIVVQDKKTEASLEKYIQQLILAMSKIKVGYFSDNPTPFMGPVISIQAAQKILEAYKKLLDQGAIPLYPLKLLQPETAWLSPGLLDVTSVKDRKDEEIFGPLLQLIRVNSFEEALLEANNTEYGLAAGIFTEDKSYFELFKNDIKAGIITWNKPTTGALSRLPFGGIGSSGNFRPSAFYAADYCAYPMSSIEASSLSLPSTLLPGLTDLRRDWLR